MPYLIRCILTGVIVLSGWQLVVASENEMWWDGFAPPPEGQGINGGVFGDALIIYGGSLFAGGNFDSAGTTPARQIARWDFSSQSWDSLGPGIGGSLGFPTVYALETFNGRLMVGGQFLDAAGLPDGDHILQWDGSTWSGVGGGLSSNVRNMILHHDTLIVAMEGPGLVRSWDGSTWVTLGGTLATRVQGLAVYGDTLYAGGDFGISKWDGSSWISITASGEIRTLEVYQDTLYAAGSPSWISRYYGGTYEPNWAHITGCMETLKSVGDTLFAAGCFQCVDPDGPGTGVDSICVNKLARYYNSLWDSLGSGIGPVGGIARGLVHTGTALFVGGSFDSAGAKPSKNIARWGPSLTPQEAPVITSILDVGNDQGRQVRLKWLRSLYDASGDTVDITSYGIYRRQDQFLTASGTAQADLWDGSVSGDGSRRLDGWDFIGTAPARGDSFYQFVAPTLCDSTSEGICWSVFFVSAMTPDPLMYFDSQPDSGYSVDNLAPAAPSGLIFAAAWQLAWEEALEEDFAYFTVHGSDTPEFEEAAIIVGYTVNPGMDVSGTAYAYYHVTATDFAGNQGVPASISSPTSVPESYSLEYALYPSLPNPFRSGTLIRFSIPDAENVLLRAFDTRGRVVATLKDELLSPGLHSIRWDVHDSEQPPLPGVYFLRLEAAGFKATTKVVVLR